MVTEWSGWCHAHRGHGLLLGNGRLALLVGPVAADGSRAKPLSVHGVESTLSIGAIPESDEAVTTRPARFHVPHDTSLGDGAKGGESLEKDLVVDFIGKIANENVEVVGGVFLGSVVGLVGPVYTDFLSGVRKDGPTRTQCLRLACRERPIAYVVVDASTVESGHATLGGTRVVIFDKAVVETLGIELLAVSGTCVVATDAR